MLLTEAALRTTGLLERFLKVRAPAGARVDVVLVRRSAGARRGVQLDFPAAILHRGAMRLIGLVVILALSLPRAA